jgi:hypothetical protein
LLVVQDRSILSRLQALRTLFEDAKQDIAFQDHLKRSFPPRSISCRSHLANRPRSCSVGKIM